MDSAITSRVLFWTLLSALGLLPAALPARSTAPIEPVALPQLAVDVRDAAGRTEDFPITVDCSSPRVVPHVRSLIDDLPGHVYTPTKPFVADGPPVVPTYLLSWSDDWPQALKDRYRDEPRVIDLELLERYDRPTRVRVLGVIASRAVERESWKYNQDVCGFGRLAAERSPGIVADAERATVALWVFLDVARHRWPDLPWRCEARVGAPSA